MHLKISARGWPFCLSHNVFTSYYVLQGFAVDEFLRLYRPPCIRHTRPIVMVLNQLKTWKGRKHDPVDTRVTHIPKWNQIHHYNDVIMGTIASQTTSLTIVYSIVCSDADQRKHQSSASLAFVRGIHRGEFPAQMASYHDVIMISLNNGLIKLNLFHSPSPHLCNIYCCHHFVTLWHIQLILQTYGT